MSRSLHSRMKFVERYSRRKTKTSVPWLRHKVLQLELWTGAYMLDPWEAIVVFAVPVIFVFLLASLFPAAPDPIVATPNNNNNANLQV